MISSAGDPKSVLLSLGLIADPQNKAISDSLVNQVEQAQARITGIRRKGLTDIERAHQESESRLGRLQDEALNRASRFRLREEDAHRKSTDRMMQDFDRAVAAKNKADERMAMAGEQAAKRMADAHKKAADEKARAADQYATASARAHRQIEAGQMRIVRGTRSVMSGTTELMRSFAYLGLSGEKSLQGIATGLLKIEAAMGAVRGAMSIAMGSARIRNASRGAVIARQLSDPAWGEAAGVGAGSMFGRVAGFVEGGGLGTLAMGAGGVAAGVGGIMGGESLLSGNLRQDIGRLTGAIDDGASKVGAALARLAGRIEGNASDFQRVTTNDSAQNKAQMMMAQGKMDIAELPNFQMTQDQIASQRGLNAVSAGVWSTNFHNALAGQSFTSRADAITGQRSIDVAQIGVMTANANKELSDRDKALNDRGSIVDDGLAKARAAKAAADATPIQSASGTSGDYNAWRADMDGAFSFGKAKMRGWASMNGRSAFNLKEKDYQDYYDHANEDDIKSGKMKPAITTGSNRGLVEGKQASAAENEVSWLEKANQLDKDRLLNTEQRKRLSVEIAKMDTESLQKQRDSLAALAISEKARLQTSKEQFAFMDPGQQLRVENSFKQFKAGKLDTSSIGGLMQMKQLHQLDLVSDEDYNNGMGKRFNKIPGAKEMYADANKRTDDIVKGADDASRKLSVALENKLQVEVVAGGFSQQAVDQVAAGINKLLEASVKKLIDDLGRQVHENQQQATVTNITKGATVGHH